MHVPSLKRKHNPFIYDCMVGPKCTNAKVVVAQLFVYGVTLLHQGLIYLMLSYNQPKYLDLGVAFSWSPN